MYIFLDIDGVLNDSQFRWEGLQRQDYSVLIDPKKVELLKKIVEETGSRIVLSSSWGKFWANNPVDSAGKRIDAALEKYGLAVSEKTPQIRNATRSQEIEAFLQNHPYVVNYVILDDNDYGWSRRLRSHWVQTNGSVGLDEEAVALTIDVLRGNLMPVPKETVWERMKRVWKERIYSP